MKFYIVGPFYPLRGGIAQYIGVLGRKFEERGHQVKVLSFRKQFPKWLFPGQTQLESSRDRIELDSKPVFIPWNPVTWLRTFLYIRRNKPDAVIFKYWMPFFAPGYAGVCALTKWFTDVRTIFILDNVIPHEKRLGDRFFTRLAFKWVDTFIAQSEVVNRDLFNWFPEAGARRVELVPHPVYDCYGDEDISQEDVRQRLNLAIDTKVMLFFGLVREYKGLDVLLYSMPEVLNGLGRNTQLIVAGEFYEPEEKYSKIVDDLELQDNVKLINKYIPNEDVGLYFHAADVLVLPYKSATQSGVTKIAHHFGLPVISTKVGGLPEVIEHEINGILVPPDKPEALAEAVIKFFTTETRATILENINQGQGDGSWEKMLNVIESVSMKLL